MEDKIYQRLLYTFNEIPFNRMLGLHLNHINAEEVSMQLPMQPSLVGNFLHGILHGGVISSVLDMAGGMIAMAAAMHQKPQLSTEEVINFMGKTSTINLNINYLRPGRGKKFIAKAWIVKSGSNISFARMELCNEEELIIASANGTYLLR